MFKIKSLYIAAFMLLVYSICTAQTGEVIRRAKDSYDNQEYKKAKELSFKIIDANPGILEGHKIFVKSSKELAEMDKCIAYYEEVCNKTYFWDKNKNAILFGLGCAYLENGKINDAKNTFEDCIKLDPKSPLVKDIQVMARKNKFDVEIPARSLGEDIKLGFIGIGIIIFLLFISMVYRGYVEKKAGERQVASIKKDRQVDFFGNIRKN